MGTTVRNAGFASGVGAPAGGCVFGVTYASPTSSVFDESVAPGWEKTRTTYSAPLSRNPARSSGVVCVKGPVGAAFSSSTSNWPLSSMS